MAQNGRGHKNDQEIPDIVIRRLPIYVRTLKMIEDAGIATVSSDDLAARIGVTAAQIRRDLSYFGKFGKQGKGYEVGNLVAEIEHILHLDRRWDVALVGYGHLGKAISAYRGFEPSSFRIAAIFDRNPDRIGQVSEAGAPVIHADHIVSVIREMGIRMGIIAVPASAGQEVADALVAAGVRAILNYAPVILRVPDSVWVREIDPTSAMQSLTYYLSDTEPLTEPLPTCKSSEMQHRVIEAADGM